MACSGKSKYTWNFLFLSFPDFEKSRDVMTFQLDSMRSRDFWRSGSKKQDDSHEGVKVSDNVADFFKRTEHRSGLSPCFRLCALRHQLREVEMRAREGEE